MNFLLVFIGGGFGSVARYAMMKAVSRIVSSDFPWHTLSVNIIGAFIIGALTEFLALRVSGVDHTRLLLITGFLGGFTTFSAFSLEGALMLQRGDYGTLAAYTITSVVGTILAVLCGGAGIKAIL
jgi:CrcB protein